MIGSARPCATNTRRPLRPGRSGAQPSTTGTKPEKARIPAGAGRSAGRPSEWLITAPIEKPPSTVRSGPTPVRSQSSSWNAASAAKDARKVSGSG